MKDVQNTRDHRNLALNKVGVRNIRYPIKILDKAEKYQHTSAEVDLYVNLPHYFKGTHMSRFIEVFHEHSRDIRMNNFLQMLEKIRSVLQAEHAHGEIRFPFFMEKAAPVSGQKSIMEYNCRFIGDVHGGNAQTGGTAGGDAQPGGTAGGDAQSGEVEASDAQSGDAQARRREFFVGVEVPVLTLCPCSREIADYGAHNQRSHVRVLVELGDFFWIEDMIALIENCASAPLYTLLKRDDEKYITERSYDNPVFVEDLVREVTVELEKRWSFPWFSVESENMESIHNHEAYACIERGKRGGRSAQELVGGQRRSGVS